MSGTPLLDWQPPARSRFDGPSYDPAFDHDRLRGQIKRVYDAIASGEWLTLNEIGEIAGDPVASISAQLRHLRKSRFGSHTIEKRPRGERAHGLWEYRLALPVPAKGEADHA